MRFEAALGAEKLPKWESKSTPNPLKIHSKFNQKTILKNDRFGVPTWRHLGSIWAQLGALLAPSWPNLEPKTASRRPQEGPSRGPAGPGGPRAAPRRPHERFLTDFGPIFGRFWEGFGGPTVPWTLIFIE